MSHSLNIKTYNPDMTINGKKVTKVFSIYVLIGNFRTALQMMETIIIYTRRS